VLANKINFFNINDLQKCFNNGINRSALVDYFKETQIYFIS